jgi:hypothetical protein
LAVISVLVLALWLAFGDALVQRIRHGAVAAACWLMIAARVLSCPIRAIRSASLTPEAAGVLPACR